MCQAHMLHGDTCGLGQPKCIDDSPCVPVGTGDARCMVHKWKDGEACYGWPGDGDKNCESGNCDGGKCKSSSWGPKNAATKTGISLVATAAAAVVLSAAARFSC